MSGWELTVETNSRKKRKSGFLKIQGFRSTASHTFWQTPMAPWTLASSSFFRFFSSRGGDGGLSSLSMRKNRTQYGKSEKKLANKRKHVGLCKPKFVDSRGGRVLTCPHH